ncbi:Mitochondrial intermediate peptidase 1 [Zancudomyces culisetae]|uniref:mitochondrial intermediate peptidase n=1 Tax=Zancudomyces culisetae TaxID=1213189 RepID=A0A1R1PS10_ZANCU|nr:Mitochondrial intermediate peptidase 1 [Zancudomyces culisetae]OMH84955.1 Mitochondrial intermediate peptidase 1 [Zancudomyces culisetae]|eukprot:OMH83770.1 Mitochondrial intermediate peptidase 1 [Zancudomyces culisetae]
MMHVQSKRYVVNSTNILRFHRKKLKSVSGFGKSYSVLRDEYVAYRKEPGENPDDYELRMTFDFPESTKTSGRKAGNIFHKKTAKKTGLFGDPRFGSPKEFEAAAKTSIKISEALVNRIMQADSNDDKAKIVKLLDQISDNLCQIMDSAEVIRQISEDYVWIQKAEEVYAFMLEYMNVLNTHYGIYTKLVGAMKDHAIMGKFGEIEQQVAKSFKEDFEKSGIQLDKAAHEKFILLNNDINELSREYMRVQQNEYGNKTAELELGEAEELRQQKMGRDLVFEMNRNAGNGKVKATFRDSFGQRLLQESTNENIRKKVYTALYGNNEETAAVLEKILEKRAELAQVVGFESYSTLVLKDKMAKTPRNVETFLTTLSKQEQPKWSALTKQLLNAQEKTKIEDKSTLQLWNREYLLGMLNDQNYLIVPRLKDYFSVGRTIAGFSNLMETLYGVKFVAEEAEPDEVWHDSVRKLRVVDTTSGKLLGIIYCDLIHRRNKAVVGAAHFTVRCSRRVDDDFVVEGTGRTGSKGQLTVVDGEKTRQVPVIVLLCNFSGRAEGGVVKSPPLSLYDVETLFHELGHAMHSMFGQTDFHNVSGTRCPIDFVELPSVLMEHFVRIPEFASKLSRHYKTGLPVSPSGISTFLDVRRRFASYDTNTQLFMSALDLHLHSSQATSHQFDWSRNVLERLHGNPHFGSADHAVFPYVPHTRWHTRFTHLLGYASCYYSYLFDRAIAGTLFHSLFPVNSETIPSFNGDPKSDSWRISGELYRKNILQWGGGRDPWLCLTNLLRSSMANHNGSSPSVIDKSHSLDQLSRGGVEAMEIVGSWGLPS